MLFLKIKKIFWSIWLYISFLAWKKNVSLSILKFEANQSNNVFERIRNMAHLHPQNQNHIRHRRKSILDFNTKKSRYKEKVNFGLIRSNFIFGLEFMTNPLFFFNYNDIMNRFSYYFYKYWQKIFSFIVYIFFFFLLVFLFYFFLINIYTEEQLMSLHKNSFIFLPECISKLELNIYDFQFFRGPIKTNLGLTYVFDDIIFSKIFHERINNLTNRLGYLGVPYNTFCVPMNNWNNFYGTTSITFPFLQYSQKQAKAAALGFQDIDLLTWMSNLRPTRFANTTHLEVLDNMGNTRQPLKQRQEFKDNTKYRKVFEDLSKYRDTFKFARRSTKFNVQPSLLEEVREHFSGTPYFINKGIDLIKENHITVFYHKDFITEAGVSDYFLSKKVQEFLTLFEFFLQEFIVFFKFLAKNEYFNVYSSIFDLCEKNSERDFSDATVHYFENNNILVLRKIKKTQGGLGNIFFVEPFLFKTDVNFGTEVLLKQPVVFDSKAAKTKLFIERLTDVAEQNRIINLLKFRYEKHPEDGTVKFRTGLDFYTDFITSLPFADPARGFFNSDFLNINDFLYEKDVIVLLKDVDAELKNNLNSFLMRFSMTFESFGLGYALSNTYSDVETAKYCINNNIFFDKALFEHYVNYTFRTPFFLDKVSFQYFDFEVYNFKTSILCKKIRNLRLNISTQNTTKKFFYYLKFLISLLEMEPSKLKKNAFYLSALSLKDLTLLHINYGKFHCNYKLIMDPSEYFFNFLKNLKLIDSIKDKIHVISYFLEYELQDSVKILKKKLAFFQNDILSEKRAFLLFRRYSLGFEQAVSYNFESTFQEQYYHGRVWNQAVNRGFTPWKKTIEAIDASATEIKNFLEEQTEAQIATYAFHNVRNNVLYCENILENKPLARQIYAPSSLKIRYRKYSPNFLQFIWYMFVDPFIPFTLIKPQFKVFEHYMPDSESLKRVNYILHNMAKHKLMHTRSSVSKLKFYSQAFEEGIVSFKSRYSVNYYRRFFRDEESRSEILALCNWLFSTNLSLDLESTDSYLMSYIISNFLSTPFFKKEFYELFRLQIPFHITRQYLLLEQPQFISNIKKIKTNLSWYGILE